MSGAFILFMIMFFLVCAYDCGYRKGVESTKKKNKYQY